MLAALTSSFHPPPSLFLNSHNLFLQISSLYFSPLNHMANIVVTTPNSSPPHSAFPKYTNQKQDITDVPFTDNSYDNQDCYIMIGTVPVSLLGKRMKKFSLSFSTSCTPPTNKHPKSEYCSNHSPSPQAPGFERRKNKRTRVDLGFPPANRDNCSEHSLSLSETSSTRNFTSHHYKSPQGSHSWKKNTLPVNREYNSHSSSRYASAGRKFDSAVRMPNYLKSFDICCRKSRNSALIGSPVDGRNKESLIEMENGEVKDGILRPGMVLLKHYLKLDEQVEIVKNCRKLGMGAGGFYQPGYGDGAKLRLLMMCLGLDWDPQTRKYGKKRAIDGSMPPCIPHHVSDLVMSAMQDAHNLIRKEYKASNVEEILPSLTPDICIVNFYNTTGRLGLHQDRDESRESLRKGLPVVSFSIGDSAVYLYGDERNVEKAEKVLLESGDVLIFGGESRHVFHGVSSIIPESAPVELLKETWLLPGRLNLTFRQY